MASKKRKVDAPVEKDEKDAPVSAPAPAIGIKKPAVEPWRVGKEIRLCFTLTHNKNGIPEDEAALQARWRTLKQTVTSDWRRKPFLQAWQSTADTVYNIPNLVAAETLDICLDGVNDDEICVDVYDQTGFDMQDLYDFVAGFCKAAGDLYDLQNRCRGVIELM